MISLALLAGLLIPVPLVSGVILIVGSRALSRLVAASWCGAVLLFSLVVVLLLIRLLTYGDTLQATAFAPAGWARWLQLSYLVANFNIFSALVIGVLASAVAVVLIALEPAQVEQPQTDQQGRIGRWNRAWQMGVLLLVLGAVFTAIFSNSALWTVLGWSLAGFCAFILSGQGQTRKRTTLLLTAPCVAGIILFLSLLPAISTRADQRMDLLNGLGREPFWAAVIMLAALLIPGAALLTVQTTTARVPRPAGMSRSAAYTLMASPVTFTAFARLALLIAGPGTVTPGRGSFGWRAFSLVILRASAALALTAAILARTAQGPARHAPNLPEHSVAQLDAGRYRHHRHGRAERRTAVQAAALPGAGRSFAGRKLQASTADPERELVVGGAGAGRAAVFRRV